MIFLSQFALELQRLMVLNFQFPTKYGVFPCLWREQDRWTLNSNDYVLGPSSRNMAVKMKRMVQWFVHWILVCPKNPFILEEVKTQKTFDFPWSTTRVCPKERADASKSIRFLTKKQHTYTGHFISVNSFHWKIYQRIFTSDLTSIFECIVCWESSQKCEVGEVVYLTQMENVVLPWVQYFFGVGTKTMQKHTHNVESVEIPFVVWGQNKWECKSRIVTHNGLMFFFSGFVGITTLPLPGVFKLFAPPFGFRHESWFLTLEISSFLVFRHMKPAFGRKSVGKSPGQKCPAQFFRWLQIIRADFMATKPPSNHPNWF